MVTILTILVLIFNDPPGLLFNNPFTISTLGPCLLKLKLKQVKTYMMRRSSSSAARP